MLRQAVVALLLSTSTLLAQTRDSPPTSPSSLAPLFAHIWRIAGRDSYPNSGSIYIFLANGTLLETSCVETYRIATWKADPDKPAAIEVTEDGRPAFAAAIAAHSDGSLQLRQTLTLGARKEARALELTAIDKEFVCPDLPK